MRRIVTGALLLSLVFGNAWLFAAQSPAPSQQVWEPLNQVFQQQGVVSPDGVYKVTFPRADLRLMMRGVPVPVGMGLASWAAFMRLPDGRAMVMGDTVMLASEVNPVIDELRKGGIEIVALHNHMLGEQPQVMFMHYQGVGEKVALARTIRRALDRLGKDQAR